MAYEDFLEEFARAQGLQSREDLLTNHAERYSFQIGSRDRARKMIDSLGARMGLSFAGKNVLDVGCAYGSFSIEMARQGARVTGIDISDKWLRLAEVNARGEFEGKFLNCDASSYRAHASLQDSGPFDIFIVNDVFEHIFDTVGLMRNISLLGTPDALIYFKVPNGQATRHVLQEGHKKVFGISLLAPDYWSEYVSAPFHVYYRRWTYFKAIFDSFGFTGLDLHNRVTDPDLDSTRRHIINDVAKIRAHLVAENFKTPAQFAFMRTATRYYFEEVQEDIDTMDWTDLFFKYRVTFWEGTIRRDPQRASAPGIPAMRGTA